MRNDPWNLRGEGLLLAVRLIPKSSRNEICGIEKLADGRTVLKVRVRAVPQDGEANAALLRLLAKALHISASAVRIEAGPSSRLKTLHLEGDAETLAAALTRLSSPGDPNQRDLV